MPDIVKDNVDILMISEPKSDDSFPEGQFLIAEFDKPFCLDRNKNGDGIMLFVGSDIPAKVLYWIRFRKEKWLLNCSYIAKCCNIESYLNCLSKSIDLLPSKYENIILLGNFNSCKDDSPMIAFCET